MDRCLMKWLRELHPPEKMVFLAGPRQVGKTTLVKQILETWRDKGVYFNWDISGHRRRILSDEDLLAEWRRPAKRPMIIFDELHKMRRFKSWLKGFYDEYKDDAAVWVTGSGRLDLYRKGGTACWAVIFSTECILFHLEKFRKQQRQILLQNRAKDG